jgi:FlaA1/EpsC-like NDP-sugar epimerase
MPRARLLLGLWIITDLCVFTGLYAAAYFLRVGPILSTDFPFDKFITATALAAPVWLLVLATTRAFSITKNQWSLRNAAYIAYSALVGVALFTIVYYFTYEAFFSRLLLIYAFGFSAAGIFLWHACWQWIFRTLLRRSPPAFPTLVVGVTRESRALLATLNRARHPLTPVAILDGRGVKDLEIDGVPVLGKLNKLEETLERFRITHLIQGSDLEQSTNLLSACRNRGITYVLLPSVLGIVEHDERVENLEGFPATFVPPKRGRLGWFFR